MATLTIRNLPDDVHARLRVRAAKAGRSMEAEARSIIESAVGLDEPKASPEDLQRLVDELFGGNKSTGVVDALIAERRREAAREEAECEAHRKRARDRS